MSNGSDASESLNDPRESLVVWDAKLQDLVFRESTVPVSYLWSALKGPEGMEGFLNKHPELNAKNVLRVLRIAGKLFCKWPTSSKRQALARQKADRRFEVARSTPGMKGGNLCFNGTGIPVETLWVNLWDEKHGGMSIDDICSTDHFCIPKDLALRVIDIAQLLFRKGMVPGEDLC